MVSYRGLDFWLRMSSIGLGIRFKMVSDITVMWGFGVRYRPQGQGVRSTIRVSCSLSVSAIGLSHEVRCQEYGMVIGISCVA